MRAASAITSDSSQRSACARQRGPIDLEFAHQAPKFRPGSRRQRSLGANAKKRAVWPPASKKESAEAQRDLGCSRYRFSRNCGWIEPANRFDGFPSLGQGALQFATRDQPGFHVAAIPRINTARSPGGGVI